MDLPFKLAPKKHDGQGIPVSTPERRCCGLGCLIDQCRRLLLVLTFSFALWAACRIDDLITAFKDLEALSNPATPATPAAPMDTRPTAAQDFTFRIAPRQRGTKKAWRATTTPLVS